MLNLLTKLSVYPREVSSNKPEIVNDIPRQKLREIVNRYGQSVVDDPRRCKALLLDYAGRYRREIFVLNTAQEEQVANDLQEMANSVPLPVLVAQLTHRLIDNRALAEDAARWAVESWVYALGMENTSSTAHTITPPPLNIAPTQQIKPATSPQPPPVSTSPLYNTFTSDQNIEVYGKPRRISNTNWQKLGATPGSVDVPPDYALGLRLSDFDDAAWEAWTSDVQNPIDVVSLALNGNVTDAGMASLRTFPNLTYLEINDAEHVTDAGMAHLVYLPHLATFNLSWGTRITDNGLAYLRSLSDLTTLSIKWSNVTDAGVRHLRSLTKLATLELRECKRLTGTGFEHLKPLSNLATLDLAGAAQLADIGLHHVGALAPLTKLDLAHCVRITRHGIVHLRRLTNLSYLDLSWNEQIGDSDIVALCDLPRLASLSLSHTNLTDTGLGHVGDIPSLIYLDLSGCAHITDKGLLHLHRLDKLAVLNVGGCNRITQRGLARLARPGLYVMR